MPVWTVWCKCSPASGSDSWIRAMARPYRLAHREPGSFRVVRKMTSAAAEAGGGGQLGHQPVPLRAGAGSALTLVTELHLVDFGAQMRQPLPVLLYRRAIQRRLYRPVGVDVSVSQRGGPDRQLDGGDLDTGVGEQDCQVKHADPVFDEHAAAAESDAPSSALAGACRRVAGRFGHSLGRFRTVFDGSLHMSGCHRHGSPRGCRAAVDCPLARDHAKGFRTNPDADGVAGSPRSGMGMERDGTPDRATSSSEMFMTTEGQTVKVRTRNLAIVVVPVVAALAAVAAPAPPVHTSASQGGVVQAMVFAPCPSDPPVIRG